MMERILINGLPGNFTEAELRKLFKPYGEVFWLKLVMHPTTGRCLGWGFVEMEWAAATQAIDDLNGLDFYGRGLIVQWATAHDDHLPCRFCQYIDFCSNNQADERTGSCAISERRLSPGEE